MMDSLILQTKKEIVEGRKIGLSEAMELSQAGLKRPYLLMTAASDIREHFKGKTVSLCGIVNAKSGRCRENCRFCAQSAHWNTDVQAYPLIAAEEIVKQAAQAGKDGAHLFGIVTSGTRISSDREWKEIFKAVEGIRAQGVLPCVSLGMIDKDKAIELKKAGLYRYHHNLETSRSFFSEICTTHDYDDDVKTVLAAKEAGLSVCSGGIIGLGETMAQRMEMACLLGELNVESVPVNILNPIAGTPLMNSKPLPPVEILVTLAMFRFVLPDKDIKLCGGKEKNLRQLLPLGLIAGCNSLMTGNYLTTSGRDTALDLEMIRDLGMEPLFEDSPD
jgi:biotin synthase